MGAYYYFINETLGVKNTKPLKYNFGLSWVVGFDGEIEIFEYVIALNGWSESDIIIAAGDNGDHYVYDGGYVEYFIESYDESESESEVFSSEESSHDFVDSSDEFEESEEIDESD